MHAQFFFRVILNYIKLYFENQNSISIKWNLESKYPPPPPVPKIER